jgi:hypothetical protein
MALRRHHARSITVGVFTSSVDSLSRQVPAENRVLLANYSIVAGLFRKMHCITGIKAKSPVMLPGSHEVITNYRINPAPE